MMNNPTDVGAIEKELERAEGYYKRAKMHLILGSDGVLERAWCLYEIAVRREAWNRSQLLFVRGSGALAENNWQAQYLVFCFALSLEILFLFCQSAYYSSYSSLVLRIFREYGKSSAQLRQEQFELLEVLISVFVQI